MKCSLKLVLPALALTLAATFLTAFEAAPMPHDQQRSAAEKLFNDGNFKDAYEGFHKLALDAADEPMVVGRDLKAATDSLERLGRSGEIDAFREDVIQLHAENWRLLQAAAENYLSVDHYGAIVAGKFERGRHRGGGHIAIAHANDRDRVRALQLLVAAFPKLAQEPDRAAVADFYLVLARALLDNFGNRDAWRLQTLTDLAELPDYEQGWYYGRAAAGAPVAPDGSPIYYAAPKTFEAATNDGERWRWALVQAVEASAAKLNEARFQRAVFLQSQFGEQTMAEYGGWFSRAADDEADENSSGTFALHTLDDGETIAKLATGVKRFELPDEHNYIKLFRQIADQPQTGDGEQALDALAQIFENRRQYDKAADTWRRAIKQFGPGQNDFRPQRLDQIVKAWGRFDNLQVQPAGKGAMVDFRFRNANKVHFEAHSIHLDKLLDDVMAYLKTRPGQLDWQRLNIQDIGYQIVQRDQQQYVGERVAAWDLDLEPRARHFDKRITVTTPLQNPGAYLLTAQVAEGNLTQIIVWLADTVLVKKPMPGKAYYFVADAVTGEGVPKANLEFFGYRQRHVGGNRFELDTANFAEFTGPDGQLIYDLGKEHEQYQWIITARAKPGRFAFLGFTNVWRANYYDPEYEATKVFAISDRPVYRPKQAVKFKFWVRHAKYDQEDESTFAHRKFAVQIVNPKGDKVLETELEADDYGGMEGEYLLTDDATLGVYQFIVDKLGGGSFRVEEYKKPEFEVKVDAPTEPVMLGEKVAATIEARYYFGAPVAKARVKYKVLRTAYQQSWYPRGDWDWFYGRGYWWFAYDAPWYPGWRSWGCKRPLPFWWGQGHQPPEVVAEAEVAIGDDGKVHFEIDTAVAKEIHGDQDHQYQIVAEVLDESRRTIVGAGNVMVARKPFTVFAWLNRGYYRAGDVIEANFEAHTLSLQPVEGKGKLKLLKITYDDERRPVEEVVDEWDLDTDAQGHARQQLKAAAAGQYRLSYTLTDSKGHAIEGGYLFTVTGQGFDGAAYRFNHLELVPELREYQPGDKVKLQINTDRVGSTVLLFVRPVNGVYLAPQLLKLAGRSTIAEIEVTKKDMPNFFVEAVTIAGGELYAETKEIVVPPEKRILNVAIEPSAETYRPGQPAAVKVTLTDFFGKPFVGSTALAIYDKSVEYISGGSNVPEIKEFFWKWRRNHYPQTESTLAHVFYNLVKQGRQMMQDLGVFGGSVADELADGADRDEKAKREVAGDKPGGFGGARRMSVLRGKAGMAEGRAGGPPGAPAAATRADDAELSANGLAGESEAELVQPTVRSNFADTALWVAALTTDGDGVATVKLDMPENLTTWKVRVWGLGHGTKVGQGETEVITRKDLLLRMQAPRFFVEKDDVVLSANVHNYLKSAKQVEVRLELDGQSLVAMDDAVRKVEIEAGGELRVDWRVRVAQEGEAVVRMKALTDEESDAIEMRFPAYVHGMLKTVAVSGAIRPENDAGKFEIAVPADRRPSQSRLEVRYSPTLAGAMVDALPYLVDYPYGCTEQTLNRFLPTVITQRVLLDMRLDLAAIRDKRTNLNAQEIGDDRKRAEQWKRFDRNPVFDATEVTKMVKDGVEKLTDMQLADGGWGWFSGWGEHSAPHTTAVVVHGLQVARQNDVALVPGMLERGVDWLKRYQDEQLRLLKRAAAKEQPFKTQADNLDAFVYMVLVDAGVLSQEMRDFLYRDRIGLAVYAKAMFGLALHKEGAGEQLAMIRENLSQFLVEDDENQTAYLRLPENNFWWYWYGSEVEAQAYYLKLLARTDPKGEVASRLVKYILNNRKHASYWNSTRDTAVAVEALAEFLKASGETECELTVEVWLDGKLQKAVEITSQNLFTFDNRFVLEGEAVTTGRHTLELRKKGRGPLYYNGYLTNFTLEDHIARAGLEIKVNRKYYKLVKIDREAQVRGSRGEAVGQKVEKYRREELVNLASLKSSDLVEIELEIDSKNDYEYLMFEDMKAAGFEPVDVRSGYGGNDLGAYMELRDDRVCFFVRQLPRGKYSVAYRLRAEVPGKFSALPTRASAMYAPELKANSDEMKIAIED